MTMTAVTTRRRQGQAEGGTDDGRSSPAETEKERVRLRVRV